MLSTVAVGEVDAAVVTSSISDAVAAADRDVAVEADAGAVTTTIDEAVAAAETDLELDADASAVTSALDAAVEDADLDPQIDADASRVTTALDEAVRSADLSPDLDADARRVTEALDQAIEDADLRPEIEADASSVTETIDDAIGNVDTELTIEAVADAVTTAIDEAVAAAENGVEIEGDASGVAEAILAAVESTDPAVTVEADAAAVVAAIEEAILAADRDVSLQAITDTITDAIEDAVAAADATVELDVDTSAAEGSLGQLGSAGDETAEEIGGTTDALGALQGTSQLAAGDLAGVSATLGAVSARGSLVAGVGLAIATALSATSGAALESDTAQRRYNDALGEYAERINRVGITGFADDLETLAERTGNSDEALKLAAARLFEFGESSGQAAPRVADTTEQILLLATRASVVNPTLGDAGAAAERLTGALARGGRTLIDFGIALTPAQIEARALADNVGKSSEELTVYDRAAAGAALATEQLGDRLRTDIVDAADQPAIALRQLREEFGNALEVIGQPLLQPLIDASREGQPILLDLAETFGELASTVLPSFIDALRVAAPVVSTVADVVQLLLGALRPILSLIDAIPDPVLAGVVAFVAFNSILGPVTTAISALIGRVALAAGPAGFAGLVSPIGLAAAALAGAIGIVTSFTAAKEEQRKKIAEVSQAFLDEATSIDADVQAIVRSRVESKNQEDDLRRLGLSVREFSSLATGGREGFLTFVEALERGGEVTPAVAAALREAGGTSGDFGQALLAAGGTAREATESNLGLVDSFTKIADEAQKAAEATLTKLVNDEKLTDAAVAQALATSRNADGTINYVAALERLAPAQEEGAEATSDAADKAAQWGRDAGDASSAADDLAEAFEREVEQAEAAEEALGELLDATVRLLNTQISTEEANRRFGESLDDVARGADAVAVANREHGRSSEEAAEAQREYEEAVRDARDAALASAEAILRLADDTATAEGRTLTAAERQSIFRGALQETADKANGPVKAAIQGLISTYDKVPAEKRTRLTADASDANKVIDAYLAKLKAIGLDPGRFRILGNAIVPGAQHGGTFTGPQVVEVGEAGRELVYVQPGVTATVLPNPQTERVLAAQSVSLDPAVQATLERLASEPRIAASIGVSAPDAATAYLTAYEITSHLEGLATRMAHG